MTQLKDICQFIGGSQPPKNKFIHEPKEGYIRLVQIRDRLNDDYITFIPKGSTKKLCEPQDILVGRYGPPIFQVFRGFSGAYNVALFKAVPLNGTDNDFLYYFIQQPALIKYVESMSLRTAGQTGVELDSLYEYPVPDFTINEQKKIAGILTCIDEKISLNNSICSDLEEIARLVFDYWFVQFDFPDDNGKPYKSNGGKMIWCNELKREIPVGWDIHNTGEFINIVRGVSYNPEDVSETPKQGYIPLIKSNNLQNGHINFENVIYIDKSLVDDSQYLTNSSVFVTMSSGSTEHVGKTAIVPFDSPYCFGAFCSKIDINPEYRCLISMFYTSDFFKRIIRTSVVGTSIKNINNAQLTDNLIALPNQKRIIELFENKLNPIIDKLGMIILENQQLSKLRDYILPLLMNGQLSVKD